MEKLLQKVTRVLQVSLPCDGTCQVDLQLFVFIVLTFILQH